MRAIIISIIFFSLLSCNNKRCDFYYCANKAGLLSSKDTRVISLDSLINFQNFRLFADKVSDTLKGCMVPYGFVYNYKDSVFTPNVDSSFNITFRTFQVISKHCSVNLLQPSLEIFLNNIDTIEINNRMNNTKQRIIPNYNYFSIMMDTIFTQIYSSKNFERPFRYIHLIVSDSLDFKIQLLPYFRIILNSYKKGIERYLSENKTSICDNELNVRDEKRIRYLRFKILIDNYDHRKSEIEIKK
jgi:hypothetical protein